MSLFFSVSVQILYRTHLFRLRFPFEVKLSSLVSAALRSCDEFEPLLMPEWTDLTVYC